MSGSTIRILGGDLERWQAVAVGRGMTLSAAVREGARRFLEEGAPADVCPSCAGPAPLRVEVPDIDPAFGHWLAGFVDGEGCFRIAENNGGRSMCCRFLINLRLDDEAILRDVHRRLGIGQISHAYRSDPRCDSKPIVRWQVYDRHGCAVLVRIFDAFPLRAKKARDFAIWREAVREWCSAGGPRSGYAGPANWGPMRELRDALEDVRAYRGPRSP